LAASSKEKPVLQFKNPVFKEGVNVTVRHGDKWLHAVSVGDTVVIKETDGEALGEAMVVGQLYLPARLIPQEVLDLEHDPKCKTHKGLFAVMKEVYPDFHEHSPCTVLLFCDPAGLDQPAPPKPKGEAKGKGGKGKGGGKPAGAGKPEGTPKGKPEGAGKPEGTEEPAGDEAPKENPDKDAPDPAPTPDTEPSTDAGGEKSQG